jgi:hypothetical protein
VALVSAFAPGGTVLMIALPIWVSGMAAAVGAWSRLSAAQHLGDEGWRASYGASNPMFAPSEAQILIALLWPTAQAAAGWFLWHAFFKDGHEITAAQTLTLLVMCTAVLLLHRAEYVVQRQRDVAKPVLVETVLTTALDRFLPMPVVLLLIATTDTLLVELACAVLLLGVEAWALHGARRAWKPHWRIGNIPAPKMPIMYEPRVRELFDGGVLSTLVGNAIVLAAIVLGGDGARWLMWPATVQTVVRIPFTIWRVMAMRRTRRWDRKAGRWDVDFPPVSIRLGASVALTVLAGVFLHYAFAAQIDVATGRSRLYSIAGFTGWDWVWLISLSLTAIQMEASAHFKRLALDRKGKSGFAMPFEQLVARLVVFAAVIGASLKLSSWQGLAVVVWLMTIVDLLAYLAERLRLLRVTAVAPLVRQSP